MVVNSVLPRVFMISCSVVNAHGKVNESMLKVTITKIPLTVLGWVIFKVGVCKNGSPDRKEDSIVVHLDLVSQSSEVRIPKVKGEPL